MPLTGRLTCDALAADAHDSRLEEQHGGLARRRIRSARVRRRRHQLRAVLEVAERVELCLFDDDGTETRVELPERDALRLARLPARVEPGQRYGFRVHGPYDPARGHRCNPSKLLLDPYAKAIEGQIDWDEACSPTASTTPERATPTTPRRTP